MLTGAADISGLDRDWRDSLQAHPMIIGWWSQCLVECWQELTGGLSSPSGGSLPWATSRWFSQSRWSKTASKQEATVLFMTWGLKLQILLEEDMARVLFINISYSNVLLGKHGSMKHCFPAVPFIVHFSNHTFTQSTAVRKDILDVYWEFRRATGFLWAFFKNQRPYNAGTCIFPILLLRHPARSALNSIHFVIGFRKGFGKLSPSKMTRAGMWSTCTPLSLLGTLLV